MKGETMTQNEESASSCSGAAVEGKRRRKNGPMISAIIVMAVGLFQIAYAVLDGWSEVVYPGQYRLLILGWFGLFFGFPLVVLGHIIYCTITAVRRCSGWSLVYLATPILLMGGIYQVVGPGDISPIMVRTNAHALGARTRIKWAGGAAKVRQEALALLTETKPTDVSPRDRTLWPESLRQLRGFTLSADAGRVAVSLQKRFRLDDFFIYIICADAADPFVGKSYPDAPLRYWRIAEGIYLCEYS
jgi:hypothetical protein